MIESSGMMATASHNILELATLQQSLVDIEIDTDACVPYQEETLREQMTRIGAYFQAGSAMQIVKVNELPDKDTALRIYALTQQAKLGDVTGERPKFWDAVNRAKWDAWNGVKGMERDEARREFLDIAYDMLRNLSIDTTDPQKQVAENAYNKCVEDARMAGKSDEEIQAETEKAVEIYN